MGRWNNYYPPYVSVAEKKAKAARKLSQLKKKQPGIRPVVINGRTLATTWWGKSWNKNLERYADYSNRIERGRSYVRHGSVLDLQIESGKIHSLVQGSRSKPYEVVIQIKSIDKINWLKIKEASSGKLDSLQDLLSGKLPADLEEVFMVKDRGLFPSPKEIEFSCSCPDWASMCKHVAATLYGVGARLDEDPSLFFKLRNVKIEDLITQAVKNKSKKLLDKAKKKSDRILDDSGISDLFGIVMDEEGPFGSKKRSRGIQGKAKLLAASRLKTKSASPNRNELEKARNVTIEAELVEKIVGKSKEGINIKELSAKTKLSATRLYTIIHRLKQQGKIVNQSRGVYIKTK